MAVRKFSRQRESIKQYLAGRSDHPTAENVYEGIRMNQPRISLGTVYRNLSLLAEMGEIQKIPAADGPDHFDWNPSPHYHFSCTCCHAVSDVELSKEHDWQLLKEAQETFDGQMERQVTMFYGICGSCLRKERKAYQQDSNSSGS